MIFTTEKALHNYNKIDVICGKIITMVLIWIYANSSKNIITVPDSSCGKVMFSQESVCRGEVYTTPLDRHPRAETPPEMATAVDGMHPTKMHSC